MISGTARGAGSPRHDQEGQNGSSEIREEDRLSPKVLDQQSAVSPEEASGM